MRIFLLDIRVSLKNQGYYLKNQGFQFKTRIISEIHLKKQNPEEKPTYLKTLGFLGF